VNKGFWDKLAKPIVGLSPMDGVTDAAMRFMTAKYGKPDVCFTEFVSAEGIRAGASRLLRDFRYDEIERPVVAQIFGKDPEAFVVAVKKAIELGFDGVDINMGCPSRNVAEKGAGAGLIENRELAGEIIKAVKEAAGDLPVSVKTRIGTTAPDESWWEFLAGRGLAAVTMHGRTFKQMYTGKADWESLAKAAKVIKAAGGLFLGNGDVDSRQEAEIFAKKYGVDGVLIGRAAMGNPWVFERTQEFNPPAGGPRTQVDEKERRFKIAIEHARKYEELFPGESFLPMRKHLAWYGRGFAGASELRQKLVLTNSADEVERVLARIG